MAPAHLPNDLGGHAHNQRSLWNFHLIHDHGAGRDEAVLANRNAVVYRNAVAQHDAVGHGPGVAQHPVAYSNIVANLNIGVAMHHRVVLHVGVLADDYLTHVSTHDCARPDA